jgi:hypothetical protein
MTEMKLKPALGEQVQYFEPAILKKVGYTTGHDGRGAGPYLALVTNNRGAGLKVCIFFPDYPPFPSLGHVPHKDDATKDQPYWDWTHPTQQARAQKRANDAA